MLGDGGMPAMRRFVTWAQALLLAWSACLVSACAQDKKEVPPFDLVSLALTVLISEQACKELAIDRETLNRFLGDKGITALELSSKGPYGAEIVSLRTRLRRQSHRHGAAFCDRVLAMFGPEGSVSPGVVNKP
jgi:hypothetical protein